MARAAQCRAGSRCRCPPRQRRHLCQRVAAYKNHGHLALASLPKEFIVALIDTMPPHAALNWLKTFRHFFRWCLDRKLVRNDPTFGIKLKTPKSGGHHTWTEDEIAAFEVRHPIGSKARTALAAGLSHAHRRGHAR